MTPPVTDNAAHRSYGASVTRIPFQNLAVLGNQESKPLSCRCLLNSDLRISTMCLYSGTEHETIRRGILTTSFASLPSSVVIRQLN